MKVTLTFVPPGGGEQEYLLKFDLPAVPQPGDYISITRPGMEGTADFIVRRTWWHLDYPTNEIYGTSDKETLGSVRSLVIECEFARGMYSSKLHEQACDRYEGNKRSVARFEASGY